MHPRRRFARPRLELLEARSVPAHLTATFSPLTHTLTMVGDAGNNELNAEGDATDPTRYYLSSPTDTINGQSGSYRSPPGVRNVVIRMLGGNDSVSFDNTSVPGSLAGNLSVNGGDGANFFQATNLSVDGSLSITNGINAIAGIDSADFASVSVRGNVTVRNASGQTVTNIGPILNGVSAIGGNLTITNGTGGDQVFLADTDVGGSVTVNNGHGDANGTAGDVVISNNHTTNRRSVIKGNVTVTYLGGSGADALADAAVIGNVTFNDGPGEFQTIIDGYATTLPVVVEGSLTIAGTGTNEVVVGSPLVIQSGTGVGLVLGRNLTVATGGGDDTLFLNRLQVGGATRLSLGGGNNAVFVDDSRFAGAFALTTGSGTDSVSVETSSGTGAPTEFGGSVTMSLGLGDDRVSLCVTPGGGQLDPGQLVAVDGTFLIHHGAGAGDDLSVAPGHVDFLFGGGPQWVA